MKSKKSKRLKTLTWGVLGAGAFFPVPIVAHAEVYLSADQAAQLIFPGVKFTQKEITLTDAQANAIEKASHEDVRSKKLTALVGPNKETVFIDQVVGKHEFITIAVGIAPDNTVRGVEILEYRETYGYQVRNPEWRKQFVGKNPGSELKLGADIRNISGATLSSSHVTAGVRRLVQTYAIIHSAL